MPMSKLTVKFLLYGRLWSLIIQGNLTGRTFDSAGACAEGANGRPYNGQLGHSGGA